MNKLLNLAVGVVVALALPIGVLAQETAAEPEVERIANGQKFGAWTVTCEAIAVNETACVLSQRLVRSSDDAFLAELLAFWSGDGSQTYFAARVPNGVFFPSGFAFRADESEDRKDFAWQSCSREICEALLTLSMEEIEALEGAESLIAGYRPNLALQPAVFRLSIDGAVEGLTALKSLSEQ